MEEREISFTRGDTYVIGFEVLNVQDALDTAYFTCRADKDRKTPELFQLSLGSGINSLGNSKYQVVIASNLTENMEVGTYYYDLELGLNGSIKTALKGKLKLTWDVTGDDNE